MGSKRLLSVLVLIAASLLLYRTCAGTGNATGTEVSLPPQLLGFWTTQTPSHADRHLEIGVGEIVFGQGAEGNERHSILSVRRDDDEKGRPIHVIHYRLADGGEETLELLFEDPVLVIVTQPEIRWLRTR